MPKALESSSKHTTYCSKKAKIRLGKDNVLFVEVRTKVFPVKLRMAGKVAGFLNQLVLSIGVFLFHFDRFVQWSML